MKTIKKHPLTVKLYWLAVMCSAAILMSLTIASADLSGTWVLNYAKSDFDDSPNYVLSKKIKIGGDAASLVLEHTLEATLGVDSIFSIPLSLTGKSTDLITSEHRTRHYTASLKDGVLQVEYSSSFPDKPDVECYHTTEQYHLSADGKQLVLNKQVKIYNGDSYTVKGIYEKQ